MPPLTDADVARIDAYWRAANYLSVGQIYLLDNPLLREPLTLRHIKPRLLGHFGTTPGLNLVYAHLNRVIRERDLDMIYIDGPAGHVVALDEVREPGARRRRAADPAPQRLQDRGADRARAHPPRGAGGAPARLRAHADLRRGPRARGGAPGAGRRARQRAGRDSCGAAPCAHQRLHVA